MKLWFKSNMIFDNKVDLKIMNEKLVKIDEKLMIICYKL